jgi:hypothetical protein
LPRRSFDHYDCDNYYDNNHDYIVNHRYQHRHDKYRYYYDYIRDVSGSV